MGNFVSKPLVDRKFDNSFKNTDPLDVRNM